MKIDGTELMKIAKKASCKAYAPYSNYRVGAALLCKSGKIYEGVNIENSSYGATICAERCAFSKAISEGENEFIAIAISGWAFDVDEDEEGAEGKYFEDKLITPCGICCQFMSEFCEKSFKIFLPSFGETPNMRTLSEFLPHAFVRYMTDKDKNGA